MKFLKKLDELNLPKKEYAIYGSGPLAIRGLRENGDLDIIVTKKLFSELSKTYNAHEDLIRVGEIEIFSRWH